MKIKVRNELLLLNLLNVILIIIVAFLPGSSLRVALGFPFIIFFPGYVTMSALYPTRDTISATHRLTLSFALSIAIVPLVLLLLNYSWGINVNSILYSICTFTAVVSVIAWLRKLRRPLSNQYNPEFNLGVPAWKHFWKADLPNRIISIILLLAIMSAIGTLVYVVRIPKSGETFTEFYILGEDGKAMSYPQTLRAGQEGVLIAGISNHEHASATYKIELTVNGIKQQEMGLITLADGEKWEKGITFSSTTVATNQKVEISLFKDGAAEPYLEPLHIWFDVVR